jgi:predicted RecB family nuclease
MKDSRSWLSVFVCDMGLSVGITVSDAMQLLGNQLLYSPSDLGNFVGCDHLTQLELAVALGKSTRPTFGNAYVDLIKHKGVEHERNFLESLLWAGHAVMQVGLGEDQDFSSAAKATTEAIYAGSKYIYQAVFLADGWHGVADFLERIDRPSALGPWSYQVLDTKLARHPRPEHALQLCFYSHALGRIQKIEPELAYVILGTQERYPIRTANVSAYYRRLLHPFHIATTTRTETAPYPCDHWMLWSFQSTCEDRWNREDHLVRVAGIRRDQVNRLMTVGVSTLTALAKARSETRVPKMAASTFERCDNHRG